MTNLQEWIHKKGKGDIPIHLLNSHLEKHPYSHLVHHIKAQQLDHSSHDFVDRIKKNHLHLHDPFQMQLLMAGIKDIRSSGLNRNQIIVPIDHEPDTPPSESTTDEEIPTEEVNIDTSDIENNPVEQAELSDQNVDNDLSDQNLVEESIEEDRTNIEIKDEEELSPFVRWLRKSKGKHTYESWRKEGIPPKKKAKARKTKKKKKKKNPLHEIAKGSLSLNDGIFSETLAELLLNQGYKKKSCYMYEQLRLKYPEKSAYFAAKIDQINKKKG